MHRFALVMTAALLTASQANAAALKLLVGGAMAAPFREVGAEFSRKSGDKLEMVADTTGALLKRMRAHENADIILVSAQGMEQLEQEHLVMPGSRADLATAAIGVSVRSGATAPDISTTDAFQRALLTAHSIAYVDPKAGGTSGIYLDGLFRRLGIYDQIAKKAVLRMQGSEVADAVASGQAELGLTFISEMAPNKGVRIAGPLPDATQNATVYSVAIPAASGHKDEARAFIAAISAQSARPIIRKAGLTPLGDKR